MIVKTMVLRCSVERAFALFTERAGQWWPAERRHTGDPASTIHIEPGGRFYERATDGREVEMGIVRQFEAPHRLLLDWFAGTGSDRPTRVEVSFEPHEQGSMVTVRHGPGEADDERYGRSAPIFGRSWDAVLTALRNHA